MLWLAVWTACGGGTEGPDLGGNDLSDPGREQGGCHVKEDCPAIPCHLAVCIGGECSYQRVEPGSPCEDATRCIASGTCNAEGGCEGTWTCDDSNPCTNDRCEAGACGHEPVESGPCDDGNPCTDGDTCESGVCVPGAPVCECESDVDCPAPTNLCLGRLACFEHHCVPDPAAQVVCEPSAHVCRENRCDPATAQCKEVVLPDGAGCDAGPCELDATCKAGECHGRPKCTSEDPCRVATCDADSGACGTAAAEDGTACNDQNPCTPNDRCQGGVCIADPAPPETCNGVDDDCDGVTDPENAIGCQDRYVDSDWDGAGDPTKKKCLCEASASYPATQGGDCDDQNPKVHPGGTEACNGIDDNCDGVTDEPGASGCKPYYADEDQDLFGDDANSACLCGPNAVYPTKVGGDCDDQNAATHPGAPDVCNGVDDDCSGKPDDSEGQTGCTNYYLDDDRDGYGIGSPKCLCQKADPYLATQSGDCDDSHSTVHPGASEICDKLDNDCNGETDEGEGLPSCQDYYLDADSDGYGRSGIGLLPKCLCHPAPPYSASVTGDCNDADPAVHPGVQALCGKDGDCDGDLRDPAEPCDDGNSTDWDGCKSCTIVEFLANTYTETDQRRPDAAFVSSDRFFIAWEGVGCYFTSCLPPPCKCIWEDDGIYARRFDAGTTNASSQFPVHTYDVGVQQDVALAASPNGVLAVWAGQGSETALTEIWARRFDATGTIVDSAAIQVNATTAGQQDSPAAVMRPDLTFRVVWTHQQHTTPGDYDVYLRAFSADGAGGPEVIVNPPPTYNYQYQGMPDIATVGSGAGTWFVVVWVSGQSATTTDTLYFRRFGWDTTPMDSTPMATVTAPDAYLLYPTVSGGTSQTDGFVIAWAQKYKASGQILIKARAYLSNGTPVGSPIQVTDFTKNATGRPDVVMLPKGRFAVVWTMADPSGSGVFLQLFKADQTPEGAAIQVNQYSSGNQTSPAIAVDPSGNLLVAWQSEGQDGSMNGIFAQRFGPNAERLFR